MKDLIVIHSYFENLISAVLKNIFNEVTGTWIYYWENYEGIVCLLMHATALLINYWLCNIIKALHCRYIVPTTKLMSNIAVFAAVLSTVKGNLQSSAWKLRSNLFQRKYKQN